jgi:hypothetical protein
MNKWIEENRDRWNEYQKSYAKKNRSKYHEREKRWRVENKDRLLEIKRDHRRHNRAVLSRYKAMKGCYICGYSRSSAALEFHHTNPDEKEMAPSQLSGYSMKRIKSEISKCVILCANCHREVHAGITDIV